MRRLRLAISAGTGALYTALTPILALVLLQPDDYGVFSILYLTFAFGISIQYSVVCEAWARTRNNQEINSDWGPYATALIALSVVTAAAALIIALSLPGLAPLAWAFAAAVFLALYRNGVRYYSVAAGHSTRVFLSDVAGIASFSVTLFALNHHARIDLVVLSWLVSGLASALVLRLPRANRGAGPIGWIRSRAASIRPLLADSLMMDLGAIGTPLILAGMLGPTRFGVYRAVSNVAMPVRLIVEPLRPMIGTMTPSRLFSRTTSLLIAGVAVLLAVCCYMALVFVVPSAKVDLGTLGALVQFAPASSLFIGTSLLGTVYYISCRTNASHRAIMTGRVAQTVLVIVMPLVGVALDGLNGAIWGFAVSSLLSAVVWLWLARARDASASQPSASPIRQE